MKSEIESLRKWQRLASLMSDDNGEDACRGCNYRCDYRGCSESGTKLLCKVTAIRREHNPLLGNGNTVLRDCCEAIMLKLVECTSYVVVGFWALKNRVKRRCLALRKNIERNIEAIKMCIGTAVDAFVKK